MYKFLTLIAFLLLNSSFIFSKTVYVSLSGNNSNGTSAENAYTTITKAAQNIVSGDIMLLRRGDVFRETVDLSSKTGIVIDAFGDSNLPIPVISGSNIITGWGTYKNNIFVSSNITKPSNLFVNNKLMLFARWPNKGWINIDTSTDLTTGGLTLNCSQLAAHSPVPNDYWKNATMRWRRWSWWFDSPTISQSTAPDKITVTPVSNANFEEGWKFYIDNKFEELDSIGEWVYYSGKAYVITGTATTNNLLIEGAARTNGLNISSSTIRNVAFRHQTDVGLSANGRSLIENCTFENIGNNSGGVAIKVGWEANALIIRNNSFVDLLNTAITWNQNRSVVQPNSYIEKNTFLRIGSIPGYGGNGSWHACGIIISNGNNVRVQHNEFDTIGYAAILLGSDKNFAEYNRINAAMYTLNDGGAIYTNCSYSTIRYNIITNTRGNLESSTGWANLGHGIWPEFLSQFHDNIIQNNVVANSGGNGIYHDNLFKGIVTDNTLYNNGTASVTLKGRGTSTIQQNNFSKNIFFAGSASQPTIKFDTGYDYGSFTNNIYANQFSDFMVNGTSSISFNEWANVYSWAEKTPNENLFRIPEYIIRGISKNRIENADLEQNNLTWNTLAGTQDGITIQNNPLFNSRCLQIYSNNSRIQCIYNASFPLVKDSLYEVKFSYALNENDLLNNVVRQSINLQLRDIPAKRTLLSYAFPVSNFKREVWFVIKMPQNINIATLAFEINATAPATLNVDNITFRKVTARKPNANELTQIHYNYSDAKTVVNLDGRDWYDLDNKLYSDTMHLAPYSSRVLMRLPYEPNLWFDNETTSIDAVTNANKWPYIIYPNPVIQTLNVESQSLIKQITIVSVNGKIWDCIQPNALRFAYSMYSYPSGLYLLKMLDADGFETVHKIVK